ncbi:MAG: hypothetical protein ACI8S6_001940, partial [Myxococcota bacterium]
MSPLLISAALFLACTPKTEDLSLEWGERGDCDPIAPTTCGLPFPSTFYMTEADTPTGWQISLGATTLPLNANDYQPSPALWNERDGWSVLGALLAHFPDTSLDGTVGHDDIGASLADGALTVILDAETGERMPHFVELDMSQDDDNRRAFMIVPAAPLDYGRRYVIGVRGLSALDGGAISPSEGFAALRDGTTTDDGDIERRRTHYNDQIFPTLEADGWSRGETILAWDMVTGSKEGITGKARWMRDDALDRIGPDGPTYTITRIEEGEDVNEWTARRVFGELTVPLYTEEDDRGTLLTRGEDGMPYYNGETTVPFTVIVPRSVWESAEPAGIIQYGHGLLGSQGEVESSYLAQLGHEHGYILIAVDWTGMKDDDFSSIVTMMVDEIDRFGIIPERSQQGFVEKLSAMRLITGALSNDDALRAPHPKTGELTSVVDTERRYYYGNSQGGILGGAYAALSPDIERAVLGVSGTPYNILLHRSVDFASYFLILQTMFPDELESAMWLGYMQTLWDPGEASGYALAMNEEPLPDTPAKQILLQAAIGDLQVTTLGAHIQARAYGAALITPAVRSVWGLEEVEGPHTGSALIEWDYGIEVPFENNPPEGSDPHGRPRKDEAGMAQLAHFLETGEVLHFCDGPCQDL